MSVFFILKNNMAIISHNFYIKKLTFGLLFGKLKNKKIYLNIL